CDAEHGPRHSLLTFASLTGVPFHQTAQTFRGPFGAPSLEHSAKLLSRNCRGFGEDVHPIIEVPLQRWTCTVPKLPRDRAQFVSHCWVSYAKALEGLVELSVELLVSAFLDIFTPGGKCDYP